MALIITENDAAEMVKELSKNEDLLGIMIDIESYLDDSNLYVWDNWIDGVLVRGPVVRKYWVDITLKYDYNDMPDPTGGLRMARNGTRIRFEKALEEVAMPIHSPSDYQPGTKKPRMKKKKVWLVHMSIPRRFVKNLHQDMLDQYDLEAEDTESAEDQLTKGGSTL
jgi:hypothetical protein